VSERRPGIRIEKAPARVSTTLSEKGKERDGEGQMNACTEESKRSGRPDTHNLKGKSYKKKFKKGAKERNLPKKTRAEKGDPERRPSSSEAQPPIS